MFRSCYSSSFSSGIRSLYLHQCLLLTVLLVVSTRFWVILTSISLLVARSFPPVCEVSPLVTEAFKQEMVSYPDKAKRDFMLSGITHGFHVGFSSAKNSLRSSSRNPKSPYLDPEVFYEYLANEVILNRVAGPFPAPSMLNLHIIPFGIIPKRGQPSKCRLILDLSYSVLTARW